MLPNGFEVVVFTVKPWPKVLCVDVGSLLKRFPPTAGGLVLGWPNGFSGSMMMVLQMARWSYQMGFPEMVALGSQKDLSFGQASDQTGFAVQVVELLQKN